MKLDFSITEVPLKKYNGADEKLFSDVSLVSSQIESLNHQYFTQWKQSGEVKDLMISNAYDHAVKLLRSVLDLHKD